MDNLSRKLDGIMSRKKKEDAAGLLRAQQNGLFFMPHN